MPVVLPQVEAHRMHPEARQKLVWAEFERRLAEQQPVYGRVLNECAGGAAVAVAGFVALLPSALASEASLDPCMLGQLQQFHIESLDAARNRLTLRDVSRGPKLAEDRDKSDLYSNI